MITVLSSRVILAEYVAARNLLTTQIRRKDNSFARLLASKTWVRRGISYRTALTPFVRARTSGPAP